MTSVIKGFQTDAPTSVRFPNLKAEPKKPSLFWEEPQIFYFIFDSTKTIAWKFVIHIELFSFVSFVAPSSRGSYNQDAVHQYLLALPTTKTTSKKSKRAMANLRDK